MYLKSPIPEVLFSAKRIILAENLRPRFEGYIRIIVCDYTLVSTNLFFFVGFIH